MTKTRDELVGEDFMQFINYNPHYLESTKWHAAWDEFLEAKMAEDPGRYALAGEAQ